MRVLLVCNSTMVAEAMRVALEAHSLEVTVLRCDEVSALPMGSDVALVDVGAPEWTGVAAGKRILANSPRLKVLALASNEEAALLPATALDGFHGCALKEASVTQLVGLMRAAATGRVTLPRRRAATRREVWSPERRDAVLLAKNLTTREREVLALLVEGQTGKEISRTLSLSVHTVRTHIQNVLAKLQVHSRFEAASFAVRHELAGDLVERRRPPLEASAR